MDTKKALQYIGVSLGILTGALIFLAVFLPATGRAQISAVIYTGTVSRGFDNSWEVDACTLYVQYYPHADSIDKYVMVQNAVDTHSYYRGLAPSVFLAAYEPHVWARAFLSDGRTPDLKLDKAVRVVTVDSARESNAVASVSSDDIYTGVWLRQGPDSVTPPTGSWGDSATGWGATGSSLAGVGPDTLTLYLFSSADTSGVGGGIVWLYPNDGGTPLKNTAGANGRLQFGADNDTFYAFAWVQGWNPAAPVPDTFPLTSSYADTLWMDQISYGAPPAPSLTTIVFTFRSAKGDTIQQAPFEYYLEADGAKVVYHMDSSSTIDPSRKFTELSSDSLGQVAVSVVPNDSILVDNNKTGKTHWVFKAYHPETGQALLGENGLKLRVPARAAALLWPDSAAAFGE